ncbi:MAG: hypothetical protein E7369_02585 [Clostridiales bacterium]|nr:hypothetical protein [Clostridiales bacterium]
MFNKKEPAAGPTIIYEPIFELDLSVEELHAFNCLIYSNPGSEERLEELTADRTDISVLQAHYSAWLIESKSYTGISEDVAQALLKKLKKLF